MADDADRRAAEVLASFEGCAACVPEGQARAPIAAAIRGAVQAERERAQSHIAAQVKIYRDNAALSPSSAAWFNQMAESLCTLAAVLADRYDPHEGA